ncbi:PAS domain S-box-containing protein [Marininema mesophilum]|uniref:PAS domain S-box-containing protein n=1 Tax=Marininema mesophilum TaxID=1048340 RepID=A0A1H2UGC3_9BACL|nr:sigma-54-dependent Fis family transcriptional regulator [Marininema mesophilum]SDW54619.1 PAS domain S-box-containing protein [Marininema mesophilum]
MKRFLIVGGGQGGEALLNSLLELKRVRVTGVVDSNPEAPAVREAYRRGIPTGDDPHLFFVDIPPDVVLDLTGAPKVYEKLCRMAEQTDTLVVSGEVANLIIQLIEEKEHWRRLRQSELDAIIHSTHDGMMAVNEQGKVTLYNRAAQRLIGREPENVMGYAIEDVFPNTRLDRVLKTGESELNYSLTLANGKKIVTNRKPVTDREGRVIGAVAVFRDMTEVLSLTQQVADLSHLKGQLQAIIDSSDEAFSVVDTEGRGVLINPAYTRLTGLRPEEVIGKPADTDISEGESMHMKVLKTREPVRGVLMKVGARRKDVAVNVAPIIVEGELKGSVGTIHDLSEIKRLNQELDRARRIIRTLEAKYTFDDIIGGSSEMLKVVEDARRAAHTRATVMLRGESGTGKELFAHAIHNDSGRKFNQFVRVNCASIPESLLESELFGYDEGAFTGARQGGKKGLFEEADGGTILLDEIGELSPITQAKLLRVLQEKEVVHVGGVKSIPVDVRVIAATNVDLEKAVQERQFREDLYYRLNVLPIQIPPLRSRREDVRALADHLINKFNQEYGRNVSHVSPAVVQRLSEYSWPGNVRELENVLGRAMIHMPLHTRVMEKEHLFSLEPPRPQPPSAEQLPVTLEKTSLAQVVAWAEESHIRKAYEECCSNKTETARQLGISVRNLYYKLEKYGIDS